MSKIITNADDLQSGMTLEEIGIIEGDATISTNKYLCLLMTYNGETVRAMFPVGYTGLPNPVAHKMLEAYQAGSRFFTLEEIVARSNGQLIIEKREASRVEGERTIEEIWEEHGNKTHLSDEQPMNGKRRVEIPLE